MKYVQTILAAALIAGFTAGAMAADTSSTASASDAKPTAHKTHHRRHHTVMMKSKKGEMHHEAAAPAQYHETWMGTPHSMNNHPTND